MSQPLHAQTMTHSQPPHFAQPNPAQALNGSTHLALPDSADTVRVTDFTAGLPAIVAAPTGLMTDWNELLDAAKARLRLSAAEMSQAAGPHSQPQPTAAQRTRSGVLECVDALDQLHATLRQELGRRQGLELEVFDAQATLAQARAELAGTQAGERQARHLAAHDALTSLPNRSRFRERLDLALGPDRPVQGGISVLYLDLDGFKPINDLHGHAVGDEVLRIIAMRLTRAVRAEDVVSRLGGDEFACLVVDRLDRQLTRLAGKLFDAVSAPLTVGELRLSVTPSIGIATHWGEGAEPDALLQRADAAMYRAKRAQCCIAFCEEVAPRGTCA